MKIDYELKRSNRKTVSINITKDLSVRVLAPRTMPKSGIDSIVLQHEGWINKHIEVQRRRSVYRAENELTTEMIAAYKAKAREYLPQRVTYFAAIMGVKPTCVKITSAQKRLGSCSYKNGLCFSYRVMLYPEDVIDYIVVHELAHIFEKNHSSKFYGVIARFLPDYKQRISHLKSLPL